MKVSVEFCFGQVSDEDVHKAAWREPVMVMQQQMDRDDEEVVGRPMRRPRQNPAPREQDQPKLG